MLRRPPTTISLTRADLAGYDVHRQQRLNEAAKRARIQNLHRLAEKASSRDPSHTEAGNPPALENGRYAQADDTEEDEADDEGGVDIKGRGGDGIDVDMDRSSPEEGEGRGVEVAQAQQAARTTQAKLQNVNPSRDEGQTQTPVQRQGTPTRGARAREPDAPVRRAARGRNRVDNTEGAEETTQGRRRRARIMGLSGSQVQRAGTGEPRTAGGRRGR